MPSFIAAGEHCGIVKRKKDASHFGITVSNYRASGSANPTPQEFTKLLRDFNRFCYSNKNSSCDMLMLTGYHGEYGVKGKLNNLNSQQLGQMVQTAQRHKVQFNHILSDSCCSVFGLKHLEGMLANGGEATGDRVTSTAYRMHDSLIEKMNQATECGLSMMPLPPDSTALKAYNRSQYILTDLELLYFDKLSNSCIPIQMKEATKDAKLNELHEFFKEPIAQLSKGDLKKISSISGHTHPQIDVEKRLKLIDDTVKSTMNTFNAPIYITKDKQEITAFGTTEHEVYHHVIGVYKNIGIVEPLLSDQDAEHSLREAGLGSDFDFLHQDLLDSNTLFTIQEKENRNELLTAKQQHDLVQSIDNLQHSFDEYKNITIGFSSSNVFNGKERPLFNLCIIHLDSLKTQIGEAKVDLKALTEHFEKLSAKVASSSKNNPIKTVILSELSKKVSDLNKHFTNFANEQAVENQAAAPELNLPNPSIDFKKKFSQAMEDLSANENNDPGFIP